MMKTQDEGKSVTETIEGGKNNKKKKKEEVIFEPKTCIPGRHKRFSHRKLSSTRIET